MRSQRIEKDDGLQERKVIPNGYVAHAGDGEAVLSGDDRRALRRCRDTMCRQGSMGDRERMPGRFLL